MNNSSFVKSCHKRRLKDEDLIGEKCFKRKGNDATTRNEPRGREIIYHNIGSPVTPTG